MSDTKHFLMFSTADWDNPFWTNKQHVATELACLGFKVLYIESVGLRAPSFNRSDIRRILTRLKKGLMPPHKVHDNIWVWSPVSLPLQQYRLVRSINKLYLSFFTKLFSLLYGFNGAWVWTYNPLTLDLWFISKQSRLIYHCVDDIKHQPGMPAAVIEDAEKRLFIRSNFIFVTSSMLYETASLYNSNTWLFENVADYRHFSQSLEHDVPLSPELLHIRKPIIGFIGAISSYKIDFDLLNHVAKNRPDWSIVLVGKVGEGEPDTDISTLSGCDNIVFMGPRTYQQLPSCLKAFDVAIIPAALNEYTHAMFPMKFFEYLSAGKRIVTTAIDSLRDYADYCEIAVDYDDFIYKIDKILNTEDTNLDARLRFARQHTYSSRTKKMLALIEQYSERC